MPDSAAARGRWFFVVAAALPCLVLLAFCVIGIHEWWLIGTRQIIVVPTPAPGATSAPEVPAARLVPLILGSGALAAVFGFAWLRGSRRALLGGYLAVGFVIGATLVRRLI